MRLVKVRSYHDEVLQPLFRMARKNFNLSLEFMGFIDNKLLTYPLFCVVITGRGNMNPKGVLVSGGVHGEEPAGVYAILKFLESDVHDFLGDYRFLVFPCINPFGFEYDCRLNSNGLNVNRSFKAGADCGEAVKVMRVLSRLSRKFVCTIDLHETDPKYVGEGFTRKDNPREFYMWEVCRDKGLRIGAEVIKRMKTVFPVCNWETIYKDKNSGGVIWYPEGCFNAIYLQETTLESYLAANYTPQAFTLETPCGWHLRHRMLAHLTALKTILELKKNA